MNEQQRKLMFSSENNKWSTPRDKFAEWDKEFHFTLDPCCTEKSALCKNFYTPKEDGLKQSWAGERVFMNPPYSNIKEWIIKCDYEWKNGVELIVGLLPVRVDTRWFQDYIYPCAYLGHRTSFISAKVRSVVRDFDWKIEIIFIKGRLKFVDLDTGHNSTPAPFPSMLVIWR